MKSIADEDAGVLGRLMRRVKGVNNVMKISIITVSYNSKKTIAQTIQSVVNQSYKNKEYIIIDGGSVDGTVDVIQTYSDQIDHWCSEKDKGVYDAMNKGLQYATGDVVAFLNSDDWYETDTLERVVNYFENNDIDCLAGKVNFVLNDRIFEDDMLKSHTEEDIHFSMIYRHPAFFVKRAIFDRIGGFNTTYRIAADYDFALRAHNSGCRIMEVLDVFTNFRRDGLSAVQFYKGKKEIKEIALNNTGEHGARLWDKINDQIQYDYLYDGTLISIAGKEDPSYVRELINNTDMLYIWGVGEGSKWPLHFFLKVGIEIKGFVDTYQNQKMFKGYEVLQPKDLPCNAFICISAERFYDEIAYQLKKLGFSNKQYVKASEVKRHILQHGKAFYTDEVWE